MFGMLSRNQKPLWADSCHIFLFVQAQECSSAAFTRDLVGSGAVQGMCMGRDLHGGPPCPPRTPWYQALSKPGSGPAPQRPVCACWTLAWSELSHRKCDSLSEASVCAELVRGTQALVWGSPRAQRGCGAAVPCCWCYQQVCRSDCGSSPGVYLSLNVLHIQKINLSDYTQVSFLFGTDFCLPGSKHFWHFS